MTSQNNHPDQAVSDDGDHPILLAVGCPSTPDIDVADSLPWTHPVLLFRIEPQLFPSEYQVGVVLMRAEEVSVERMDQCIALFPEAAVAVYEATGLASLLPLVVNGSLKGVFRKGDSPELIDKGLAQLHCGHLWLPRELMELTIESRCGGGKVRALPAIGLTERECEMLQLLRSGASNNEIAEALSISFHTVKTHFTHIFKKAGVKSRTELLSLINGA